MKWSFVARRKVARTPRVALGELQEGVVARVVGRAGKLDDVLEAPLTGRACVYYRVTIAQPIWAFGRVLAREERGITFTIDDATGHAIIDPSGCIIDLAKDGRDDTVSHIPNGREVALLARFGIEAKEWVEMERGRAPVRLDRSFIFREAIIEVGETIAIVGSAVREPDPSAPPEAAYRGDPPTRLRMTSSRKQPMIISDSPLATT